MMGSSASLLLCGGIYTVLLFGVLLLLAIMNLARPNYIF